MRKIVQYWDQCNVPSAIGIRMSGWRAAHPSWDYSVFNRVSASAWFDAAYGSALGEAFLDIRFPAMQADVFRVAYLLAHGGVWIDAGTTCLQPLFAWLDLSLPLVLLRRPHQEPPKVWNGFIYASAPGHALLAEAWRRIADDLCARRGHRFFQEFGPGLLRDLMADGAYDDIVSVLPSEALSQMLKPGSSRDVLPLDRHWSVRQRHESLYFSRP